MRASAERIFRSHFPKATIERRKNQRSGGYYLVRKERTAFMPVGDGETKAKAWKRACKQCGLGALYDGLCPRGKHGLDYAGQQCDLCAKGEAAMTTKPNPVGRPPRAGKSASDRRISIRVTEKEFRAWTKCAGNLPLGEWLRRLANQGAAL
jgi:hypothetical protein